MPTHDVVSDYAGFNQSRPRPTCKTEGCNDATLTCQPFMNEQRWEVEMEAFRVKHPFDKARRIP